ncbi:oligosaccharide flippase family protein [Streptococcus suis]|uniref:oligosaccharide flippase family protein n=1 Tax=Streptococcus suis TaxID=1307 RepID=UPI000CF43CE8|nr:oligosaccharide flippase family protein [Streptococcus suis]
MSRAKYLLKNTAIFAIGTFSTKIISFLLVPMYTFVLTPSQYGILDLIFLYITILSPFVMLNLGDSILRFSMDKDSNRNSILSISLVTFFCGAIISFFLLPLFHFSSKFHEYSLLIIIYLIMYSGNILFTSYLRGAELLTEYTICNIVGSLMTALLNILFLVQFKWGIRGYLLAYIFSYTITNLLAVILGKQFSVIKKFNFDKELFSKMFRYSIALVPNSLLWWVINSSDRLMVAGITGLTAAGIYGVSYKIPSMLSVFSNIFFQAWGYSAVKEMSSEDNLKYNNQVLLRLVSFLGLVTGFLLLIIKPLVSNIFQSDYFISWQPSAYLISSFYFLSISTFVATPYFTYKNSVGSMLSATVGAIVNLILNFVFIPLYGMNGAALATLVSYIVVLLYRIFDTRKYLKLDICNRKIILISAIVVIMMITVLTSDKYYDLFLLLEFIILVLINKNFIQDIFLNLLKVRKK